MDEKEPPDGLNCELGFGSNDDPSQGSTPEHIEDVSAGDLVKRIASGDPESQGELYSRYYRGLYYTLVKNGADPALAEDLVHDTILTVFENIRSNKINNPNTINTYIRNTGIFKLIAHKRKHQRRKTENSSETIEDRADENTSIFMKISHQQSAEFVRRVLEELNVERDREILRRFYLYEQDKKLICKHMKITPDNFDRVKSRALKRLRELIEKEFSDDPDGNNDGPRNNMLCLFMLPAAIILPQIKGYLGYLSINVSLYKITTYKRRCENRNHSRTSLIGPAALAARNDSSFRTPNLI